jgi:phosphatidate cytidylyltransferase
VTRTRVLTALVLVPAVLALVIWGPNWLVAAAIGAVILLSLHEFFAIGAAAQMQGFKKWAMVCAVVLVALRLEEAMRTFTPSRALLKVWLPPEYALLLFVLGAGVLMVRNRQPVGATLSRFGVSAAAMLFVAYPLSFLVLLQSAAHTERAGLLAALVLVWVGDTAAYFAGRAWGRWLLAPEISPKKTWVGAIANLLAAWLVVGVVCPVFREGLGRAEWLGWFGLATVVSVAGQIGDLAESAFKRSAGVKDAGSLLPGHGGMLDRIDALLLAAPAAWVYLTFVARMFPR